MDLTAVLSRAAAVRPRVLLVTMPVAGTQVRLAAEREFAVRDLPVALTPADADLLLVAGPRCPALDEAVDRLWRDMPAPRARVRAERAGEVAPALASGRARLADAAGQRAGLLAAASGGDDGSPSHDAADGGDAHQMPAGLPMAEQGPDRDGLALDRLHVPLGPLLADWPSGLTLRLTLQGDVVQEARIETAAPFPTAAAPSFWSEPWARAIAGERVEAGEAARRRAASHLDSLARLLAVAGWPATATAARRLRDDLLAGAAADAVRPRARRLAARVGRSRTLYWLTRGIGPLTAGEAAAAGVGGPAARADGDVPARYRLWLAAVLDDLDRLADTSALDPGRDEGPRGPLDGRRNPSAALAEVLPRLLEGAELAAARLIVASLDPDPEELTGRPAEVARG
ncbi:hypothetical protein [Streptomyces sp. NPDC006274]|uniref:hypothetical protein n=1 Tax=unclassified Streptomyces TaxID=2593676 RepID=UPI0033BBADC2